MALCNPKLRPLSLIPLFLLMLLANKVHSQGPISFSFDSFESSSNELIHQGDAHVPPGSSFLRLTGTSASGNPLRDSVGRVLYSRPLFFWDEIFWPQRQASFETTIRFVIRPTTTDPADGVAFFIAPVNSAIPTGSNGGGLGVYGPMHVPDFSLFVVEFDTYVNDMWDPNYRHIGININSRRSRRVTRFENTFRQVVTANIKYDSFSRKITVVATAGSQTFTVSDFIDLKRILQPNVQVGISASTGDAVAIHDVLSWSFNSTLVLDPFIDEGNSEDVEYNNQKNEEAYIKQYV